jgi:hypothetical protein
MIINLGCVSVIGNKDEIKDFVHMVEMAVDYCYEYTSVEEWTKYDNMLTALLAHLEQED